MRRLAISVLLAAIGTSCSGTPTMIPVKGQVMIDHKPMADVIVYFWPVVSTPETFGYRHSMGVTDGDGHFSLKCSRDGLNGIEGGDYYVTFSKAVDPPTPSTGDNAKSHNARPGRKKVEKGRRVESIPLPYSDHAHPMNSPRKVTVSSTSREFTFDLPAK
jgi:hypothetical protein